MWIGGQKREMIWICACGTEIDLTTLEQEKGFIMSKTVCPECGQEYVLRLTKGKKIRV